jgi:hypothetical protein
MHLTFFQSVYLKQVRSLAEILFRKFFGPRLDCYCYAGPKAALIQLMAQVGILFACYISSG